MHSGKKVIRWVAVVAIVMILTGIQLYLQVVPPVTVVSSGSMQHSGNWQANVLNTGDMALVKKVNSVSGVVTYVQGRDSGMKSFGEYGNVIIYRNLAGTLIIHRAILYLNWHNGNPVVEGYHNQSWLNITKNRIVIYDVGYSHRNLLINIGNYLNQSGFITTGDYNLGSLNISYNRALNAYAAADQDGIFTFNDPPVNISQVVGKAVLGIPWLGLIKLTFEWNFGLQKQTTPVPNGAYTGLAATLFVIFALVFFPYRRVGRILLTKRK